MYRIIYFFSLIILFSVPSQAQLRFGVTAGLNITQFHLSNDDYKNVVNLNKAGFIVGPTLIYSNVKTGLGFDFSVLFDKRRAKSKTYSDYKAVNCNSFQFPLNVRYGMNLGDMVDAFVFTGPQFGVSTGSKDQFIIAGTGTNTSHAMERRWESQKSTFSWNFGIGGVVLEKVQVKISYNFAFHKTGELYQIDLDEGTSKTLSGGKVHACQVALSYLF